MLLSAIFNFYGYYCWKKFPRFFRVIPGRESSCLKSSVVGKSFGMLKFNSTRISMLEFSLSHKIPSFPNNLLHRPRNEWSADPFVDCATSSSVVFWIMNFFHAFVTEIPKENNIPILRRATSAERWRGVLIHRPALVPDLFAQRHRGNGWIVHGNYWRESVRCESDAAPRSVSLPLDKRLRRNSATTPEIIKVTAVLKLYTGR